MEYDVWECYTNWRVTYKAVPTKGCSLDDAVAPHNAVSHLDRVFASNKRQAIHETVKRLNADKKNRH